MSDAAVTVVWLEESEAPDARRALSEWARARGISLRTPADSSTRAALSTSEDVVSQIESDLALAREGFVQQDTDAVERALARAEAAVIAHPELPQAAWLRADVERAWAARFSHLDPKDDERALLAWERANALGGQRVAALTEPGTNAELPRAHVTLRLPHEEELYVDGHVVTTDALDIAEGPHHFRVARDGRTIRAEWISVAPGQTLDLGADQDRGACSKSDFARVAKRGESVNADGVRCGNWIAVVPRLEPSTIEVASCERDQCAGFLEWRAANALPAEPAFQERKHWPGWATWTLAGVGAVAAATITIIATGVLEAHQKDTRFTNGGLQSQ